jgi:hypothetical protein
VHDHADAASLRQITRRLGGSAVHVAYALRWLELGEEAAPIERVAATVAGGSRR